MEGLEVHGVSFILRCGDMCTRGPVLPPDTAGGCNDARHVAGKVTP